MFSTATITRLPRRWSAALAALALVVTGLVLLPAPVAYADPVVLQPGELVINGGAEQAATVGWTGSLGRATHGSGGYPASVIVGPGGATGGTYPGGNALFTGAGAASTASQTIDLTPSAAAIDNGNVDALLSAYVGGYTNQNDNATLTYTFRDAGAATVGTVVFGPVMPAHRGNVAGFVGFSQTLPLPVGTRSVVITITTQRFVAPANDGYIDNVSLILDAPSPTALADTANTNQGTPVTLNPPTNDIAGTGAAIVPTSVRLLSGTTEVTSLTTAEGTYVVDTATGQVQFTPVATFFGTTTPVPYRITDSSGQRADSTLTVNVAFVAVPGLAMVKSASPSDPAAFTLGTLVTYSFVVTNTGNVAMNDIGIDEVTFTGSDPMSAVTCPQPSLNPGEQQVCTATYTITAADVAGGGVDNTATATGTPAGTVVPLISGPSSFHMPITAVPAISLDKTVDALAASTAGDSVTYSFLVTNTGNVGVNTVAITEDAFTGNGPSPVVSCPAGTLLPGQVVTCTAPYALTQADVDTGTVNNTATATAVGLSGGPTSSTQSSASFSVAAQPAFTFAKTANRSAITAVGQLVTYSFTVVNTGNVTLSSPVITEVTFNGAGSLSSITCPASSVVPAASLPCTATYTSVAADLDEATLSNSASAELNDPSGATLLSAVSAVVIPITLAAPTTTPSSALAATGFDSAGPLLIGLALMLLGAAAATVAALRQRRRVQ